MEKRWKPAEEAPIAQVREVMQSLGISPILARILAQRGIANFDAAKQYFRPDPSALHDPFLMHEMQHAVHLLGTALEQGQKIRVYGDYDVDGTSAVALVYGFLKKYEARVDFYIPDRYTEGYGVSNQGIDAAIADGVQLLITLDCGIRATDTLERAKAAGIQVIVCDHHLPGDTLPEVDAILDPKKAQCAYPFKELCGCGIGFKLLQALVQQYSLEPEILWAQVDLVAIATAADIVSMTGENRVLTALGLQQLNAASRPGIQAMLDAAGSNKALQVSDLVFLIAPRINAAGRIHHGATAVKLLAGELSEEAAKLAKELQNLNTERRNLDKEIAAEALAEIAMGNTHKHSTVVYQANWHKGVVGIVASRLIEKHHKPTVVLCKSEDKVTGSVRSIPGFNVHDALVSCQEYLEQFGGHASAAGLTMKEEHVPAFAKKFEEVVSSQLTETDLVPELVYDAEIALHQITPKFYRILKQMEPFGPDNLRPVFLIKDVLDTGWAKVVGEDHLKLRLKQADSEAISMNAIAFKQAEHLPLVQSKKPFQVLASIEENHWNGQVSLQLVVQDIKP